MIKHLVVALVIGAGLQPVDAARDSLKIQGMLGRDSLSGLTTAKIAIDDEVIESLKRVVDTTGSLNIKSPPSDTPDRKYPKIALVSGRTLQGYVASLSVFQNVVTESNPRKSVYIRTYHIELKEPVGTLTEEVVLLLEQFKSDYRYAQESPVDVQKGREI